MDPAKLSSRYVKTGLEAPSEVNLKSIITARNQHSNQKSTSRHSRDEKGEKGII